MLLIMVMKTSKTTMASCKELTLVISILPSLETCSAASFWIIFDCNGDDDVDGINDCDGKGADESK